MCCLSWAPQLSNPDLFFPCRFYSKSQSWVAPSSLSGLCALSHHLTHPFTASVLLKLSPSHFLAARTMNSGCLGYSFPPLLLPLPRGRAPALALGPVASPALPQCEWCQGSNHSSTGLPTGQGSSFGASGQLCGATRNSQGLQFHLLPNQILRHLDRPAFRPLGACQGLSPHRHSVGLT